jgi:archaemetzincin
MQKSKLPNLGMGLLADHGHRLTRGDVEAGQQVRDLRHIERLSHGLGGASQGKASAHACCLLGLLFPYSNNRGEAPVVEPYLALEEKLRPLADPLPPPRHGDWLAEHGEPGQTFAEYVESQPVCKSEKFHTIHLCLVGDFTETQRRILDLTQDYLSVFFDCPVEVNRRIGLASIPARARRIHPSWGDKQVLTKYILREVLEPERPPDALAYLALTASDLWPGKGWNFLFGEADLRERVGVWSIYRNGDPETDFLLCLRRTLATASHETGHILGMRHCTAFCCLMNGCNHQEEDDRTPLHLCPVCLRKLCWNLQVEPVPYLRRLRAFCSQHGFDAEADWYDRAKKALTA